MRIILHPTGPNSKAHLALLASSLVFGLNYWIAKALMPDYLNPAQIIFFRIVVSAGLFWLTALFLKKENVEIPDLWRIALCSLLGVVLNPYLFFLGLRLSNPVETAILHTTSPIVVLVFAAWILREKVTTPKLTGIAVGAAGALLIVLNGRQLSFSSDTFLGNVFILLNITFYSLYLVLIKPVMLKYHPITVMKWAFLFAMVVVFPLTFPAAMQVNWKAFPGIIWFDFLYVVIGTTYLAYLLVTISLQRLSAAVVGFYIYLQPLIATIHGIILEKEKLTAVKLLAALLIFSGVWLVNRKTRYRLKEVAERDK
ncbi:MAG TPA: DMT family transporter [Bacteroidales bacterium]|nr:DMT family transporter [Bacteroidales bacterium]HSA43025.1 DMT family transporter [Bacteroidales bacterium]